jgi:hypothetical protein
MTVEKTEVNCLAALVRCVHAVVVTVLIAASFAGCAQTAYEALQRSRELECQKMQGKDDRDACMKQSEISYQEYRRQRDEAPKNK